MIITADARHLPICDDVVNCVVTSPPYWGLRNYADNPNQIGLEPTPEAYVANIVAVFRELWRVLREDGTVWLNLGDCYNAYNGGAGPSSSISAGAATSERPRLAPGYGLRNKGLKPKDLIGIPWRAALALQADGWYLRSDIIWAKPNPMPESVTDRPTRSHEYVFLLTKAERYYYDAKAIAEPSVCEAGTAGTWDGNRDFGLPDGWQDSVWKAEPRRQRRRHTQQAQCLDHPHVALLRRPLRHVSRAASRAVHSRRLPDGRSRVRPLHRQWHRGSRSRAHGPSMGRDRLVLSRLVTGPHSATGAEMGLTITLYVYCCVHRRTVPLAHATLDPLTGLYVCHGCAGEKVAY